MTAITYSAVAPITLSEIEDEPRARDLDLADRLGFKRPRVIRELIERNLAELEGFGVCRAVRRTSGAKGGRPSTEYWLNEEQALLVSVLSNAPNAPAVRAMLIKVFVAWRRGHLAEADPRARETNGISKMTIHKVTNLEKGLAALSERVNSLMLAADPRVAALEYVSVRELLNEAKAEQKGRRGLNKKVGNELKKRALLNTPPIPLRKCPHSGVWLYPRDFAALYMAERGNILVHDHNAAAAGQGVLKFSRGRYKSVLAAVSSELGAH